MPASTVVRWLQLNLALSMAGISAVVAVSGFLITGTLGYADFHQRIGDTEAAIASVHRDLASADARLNALQAALNTMDKQISLLEAQFRWEASRAASPPIRR